MNAIRTRIHDLTGHRRWAGLSDIREVIRKLNPVLRGWAGTSARAMPPASSTRLMRTCISGCYGCSCGAAVNGAGDPAVPSDFCAWPHRRLVQEHGLYRLLGTIRYPGGMHAA